MFNLLAQKSNSYIADAIYGYFAKTLGSWQSVVQIADFQRSQAGAEIRTAFEVSVMELDPLTPAFGS